MKLTSALYFFLLIFNSCHNQISSNLNENGNQVLHDSSENNSEINNLSAIKTGEEINLSNYRLIINNGKGFRIQLKNLDGIQAIFQIDPLHKIIALDINTP